MQRLKPGVDIVLEILQEVVKQQPGNAFSLSILSQYQERGGLSKKQLQGLYGKAQRLSTIPPGKLATLEAIILRKSEKEKTAPPAALPTFQKDEEAGKMIGRILEKFPQHKRVLFLQAKYNNNETLLVTETDELKKFLKLIK